MTQVIKGVMAMKNPNLNFCKNKLLYRICKVNKCKKKTNNNIDIIKVSFKLKKVYA